MMMITLFKSSLLLMLFVLSCCAQEQLTCLRSPASPIGSSIFNNEAARELMQGPPGKKGPIGLRGAGGKKGQKGDPGIPDNSVVNQLRNEISSLQEQLTNQSDKMVVMEKLLEFKLTAFRNGFARLDDRWIGLSNGYKYKLLSSTNNYTASRQFCQGIGADLAVYGIRSMENRRILKKTLNPSIAMWIGMTDIDVEGTWKWINGDLVTDDDALWGGGQPNNGGNGENCAAINHVELLSHDFPCSEGLQGMCEKQWN